MRETFFFLNEMNHLFICVLFVPLCSGNSLQGLWNFSQNGVSGVAPESSEKYSKVRSERADRVKRQGESGLGYIPECKDGYENINGSTMCLVDSPNYIEGTAGLSDIDKETILREHNKYRRGVDPPAKAMRKLYWDDELAKLAEKWAKQCVVGHDLGNARFTPHYNTIPGQNGGYQLPDWEAVIGSWYSERNLFQYGKDPEEYIGPNGWLQIGHYSMMVIDEVALIGCGYAKCNTGAVDYFFCNYIPEPNLIPFPYRIGLPCTSCPNNCSKNLCDCGEIFCFNNGNLDLHTCSCSCQFPYKGARCLIDPCPGSRCSNDGVLNVDTCTCSCPYPYIGDLCATLNCDFRPDGEACDTLSTDYCVFKSIRKACPMLCGICPDFCPGLRCENGKKNISNCQCYYPCGNRTCQRRGKLDVDTCNCTCNYPYTGSDCELTGCAAKLDPDFCQIYWPKYLCTFSLILKYCPVMCDVCPGPCANINCQNHGLLTKECVCRCHYPFTGLECETKNCSNKLDRPECGIDWPPSFCPRFSNVRIYCPNLCGICPAVCNGKLCMNFGILNVDTCTCQCHQNFTGDFCQTEKCGGKSCYNYGTLDLDTCYCHCPPNYTGDGCEVWACPDNDPNECGTSLMPAYQCFTHWDVPFICPYMCGHCPFI